ncbi:PfkB family carbohydrate kinase [Streptomyces sp. NPDC002262]|uniref:PfkB family carbohydrate kinase n=1 Tax=Streptomyces sp. NPDC002262 TaxID=3154414 RepID=UPI00332D53A4
METEERGDTVESIVVAGQLLVELEHEAGIDAYRQHVGGSVADVAVGLRQLGITCAVVAASGRDHLGDQVRARLARHGVPIRGERGPEPTALVFRGPQGFLSRPHGLEERLRRRPTACPLVSGHVALHAEQPSVWSRSEVALVTETMAEAARGGQLAVSLVANCWHSDRREALLAARDVEQMVPFAHVVRGNWEDLARMYPGWSVRGIADRWLALGPGAVVITGGADGAYARVRNHRIVVPSTPPSVRHARRRESGAAFTAGLLHHLHKGGILTPQGLARPAASEIEQAMEFALSIAAAAGGTAAAGPVSAASRAKPATPGAGLAAR